MANRLTLGVAARLSAYLRILAQARKQGRNRISSQEISEYANVNPTQVRRDLSTFGKFGKRGVGYGIEPLMNEIQGLLHTGGTHDIALVGMGNLGAAIARSSIFRDHGFRIVAAFDSDPGKVGTKVDGLEVHPASEISERCRRMDVVLGIIAVPPKEAQTVADALVEGGVRIIFNYSESLLEAPEGVIVHTVNPVEEMLYSLYFYLT